MAKPKKAVSAPSELTAHAGTKNQVRFTEEIKHGKLQFLPVKRGPNPEDRYLIAEFEDPAAAAYFDIAFNGTELVSGETPDVTLTNEEINFNPDDPSGNETIDPHTIIGHGREGVTPGTTVHQVASGDKAAGRGEAPLKVKSVKGTAEAPL